MTSLTEPDARPTAGASPDDAAAFLDVVREHDVRLRSLAFRLLGDAHAMDDALQEAYLKAYRSRGSFRGDAAVGTWLYRITYNVCLDMLRGRRQTESLDAVADAVSADPDPALVATDRADLGAALAALPTDQRAAVLLVDAHGLDYAAAAEILGVAAGTVGSRVSRGRAALRAALTPGDDR